MPDIYKIYTDLYIALGHIAISSKEDGHRIELFNLWCMAAKT